MPSSVRKRTRRSRTSSSAMSVAYARVQEGVGDIDDQVRDDDEERAEEDRALDHRQVGVVDAGVGQPADARDVEDDLGENRAAEQDADVEAEDRHDRRD